MSYYTQLWDREWLYDHYVVQNLNATEIAKIVGCVPSSVIAALKREQIETKSGSEAQQASLVPRVGSTAPRPRGIFKSTLHNPDWLKENWLDCFNESEVGRRAGASPVSANKALQKLFESDPAIPRHKPGDNAKDRVMPFVNRPGRRTTVEPSLGFQYQESRRIKDTMDPTCAICGDTNQHKKEVNHRDRSPWNNDLSNLESLCVKCHRAQHTAEEWLAIEKWLDDGGDYLTLHEKARAEILSGVDIKERVLKKLRPKDVALLDLPIYYDRDWLVQKYVVEGRTTYEMAEEAGTSQSSIMRRLRAEKVTRR